MIIQGVAGNWEIGESSVWKVKAALKEEQMLHEMEFYIKQPHTFQALEHTVWDCNNSMSPRVLNNDQQLCR